MSMTEKVMVFCTLSIYVIV